MTTTFVDNSTVITAAWLNSVETAKQGQGVGTATSGQTVFTIPFTCANDYPVRVYIDGVKQAYSSSYTRTSPTEITFSEGLHVGAIVEIQG
jgi:hypothetical protein